MQIDVCRTIAVMSVNINTVGHIWPVISLKEEKSRVLLCRESVPSAVKSQQFRSTADPSEEWRHDHAARGGQGVMTVRRPVGGRWEDRPPGVWPRRRRRPWVGWRGCRSAHQDLFRPTQTQRSMWSLSFRRLARAREMGVLQLRFPVNVSILDRLLRLLCRRSPYATLEFWSARGMLRLCFRHSSLEVLVGDTISIFLVCELWFYNALLNFPFHSVSS